MVTAAYFKSFDKKYFSSSPKASHDVVAKSCWLKRPRATHLFASLTAMFADIML
jgi:hypothetical protein